MTPTDFTGRNTANACEVLSYQLPVRVDGIAQFLDENGIGTTQQVRVLRA